MKKLMRKLVLSSFALGLAVITLSTTTFAWYTSNVKVTAEEISGTTAESGTELLLITENSEDGLPYGYSTSVKMENESVHEMVPVQRNSFGNYSEIDADDATVPNTGDSVKVLKFTLYFKLSSTTPQDLFLSELKLTNETAKTALPKKDVLTVGRQHLIDYDKGSTYTIDVLRTLMVDINSTVYTRKADGEAPTHVESVDPNPINWLLNPEYLYEEDQIDDSFAEGHSNAHKYLELVMSKELAYDQDHLYTNQMGVYKGISETDESYTALKLSSLPTAGTAYTGDDYVKVEFVIFINGWDLACFDACQGQTFSLELAFTTKSGSALRVKADTKAADTTPFEEPVDGE